MKLQRYGIDAFDRLTAQDHGPLVYYSDVVPLLPKWISVEERLPEPYEDVLVINEEGSSFVDNVSPDGVWIDVFDATHWMPLPPLPTGHQ